MALGFADKVARQVEFIDVMMIKVALPIWASLQSNQPLKFLTKGEWPITSKRRDEWQLAFS
jgi:hypothetical protein